ncbi:MAG: hypothetical protein E6H06_03315 [Bacteroidetes bacterium]|nr:MAG: hypothetical protein E6H06_03315 [Bacteroidota bacterium]
MNTSGIGAKAYLFAKGKMQYQQLMLTRGFQSSCEPKLHFGLDSLHSIDSILIVWPDQKYQVIKNFATNKNVIVKQIEASGHFNYDDFFPKKENLWQDITSTVDCKWKHIEDDFLDFNVQNLIPHQLSTRGPKIAVGDVNKDGLDDFFACGAKEHPGCLMIQTKDGKFIQSDTAIFNKAALSEDVDAVFFDANNDSYPDLFVVSGGNEYDAGNPNLADRLYMNDGKGHFTLAENALPQILTNKSCVSVADIDKDGDMDLFIGGLADAKKYGLPQSSYLLINDGKGNFKQADQTIIKLNELGMVTTSSFVDVNNDGWMDLIATGEWMPLKVFINNKGTFTLRDINQSTGLWQTIYCADMNGDGFPDILAGNWGRNSKLNANKDSPLKLYIKDFDNNGTVEQIIAYTVNGKEYPFLGKDQLELSLPILKKEHLSYDEVAGKTLQYMFGELFAGYTELKAETLSSSWFINDGKGNFTREDLPAELQLAPIFSFASWAVGNEINYVAAGNFYGVLPYEGRYDAMNPTLFNYDKRLGQFVTLSEFSSIDGECRDAKWINAGGRKKVLIVARNNKQLIFLKPAP